jgi:hypothetical protein
MKNVFSKLDPVLVPCATKYSFFFDFVAKELPGPNTAPLHRICSLMRKMKVKCFLREELEHDAEISAELAALSLRTGKTIKADAVRFTFFRRAPAGGVWQDLVEEDLLGYVVILRFNPPLEFEGPDKTKFQKYGYIFEAVIVPPMVTLPNGETESVTNYYVHCCREFETTIGTSVKQKEFRFRGTFFCQQNGYTNACAHAALRMAINSWPAFRGPKLTHEEINKILKVDHSKLIGIQNPGIQARDIADVVRVLGHEATIASFVERPDINYEDYIYPLIESGCPVILGIASPRMAHVVTVLGHTLNSDRWAQARHQYGTVPDSRYISASAWADHFIVNDDNFGMYVTLPSEAVKNIIVPKYNPNLYAAIAIGLLPENLNQANSGPKGFVDGYTAEQRAAMMLQKLLRITTPAPTNRWFTLLKSGHAPVCRTVLRKKLAYLETLAEMADEKGNKISAKELKLVEASLPDHIWVTEVMTPDLYVGNKRKLGEIVVSTATPLACVFAWLAGEAWLTTGRFIWPIVGHVPLTRGVPIEKCRLEW